MTGSEGGCDGGARAPNLADVNAVVGGYLRDLAFAQSSQQKMFGYKRAAAAIFALDTPLTDLVGPDGAWPKIPGIGPGSARVIREVLETGGSPTVEQAIEASDRHADIQRPLEHHLPAFVGCGVVARLVANAVVGVTAFNADGA